jgi:hypothetical protein
LGPKPIFPLKQRQNNQKYPNFRKNNGTWYFNTTAVDWFARRSVIASRNKFLRGNPE